MCICVLAYMQIPWKATDMTSPKARVIGIYKFPNVGAVSKTQVLNKGHMHSDCQALSPAYYIHTL